MNNLCIEIEDEPSFKDYIRIEPRIFHELGVRLTSRLQIVTNYRKVLSIALRHFATRDTYMSPVYNF